MLLLNQYERHGGMLTSANGQRFRLLNMMFGLYSSIMISARLVNPDEKHEEDGCIYLLRDLLRSTPEIPVFFVIARFESPLASLLQLLFATTTL